MLTREEREALAAAIIDRHHPRLNALTKPDDALTMLRSDPNFFVCRDALTLADALAPVVERIVAARVDGVVAAVKQALSTGSDGEHLSRASTRAVRTALRAAQPAAEGDGAPEVVAGAREGVEHGSGCTNKTCRGKRCGL